MEITENSKLKSQKLKVNSKFKDELKQITKIKLPLLIPSLGISNCWRDATQCKLIIIFSPPL
jgi:hypothetical protein